MFFGNEKINRKSCSEEKKVRGKTVYFYGLESGLGNARRKTFRVARRFIGRRKRVLGSFCRFFQNFFGIFCNFFGKFLQFFGKFLQFFGKFLQNFCNFFQPLRFPYDFSENSCPQSVTVQPRSRHIVSLQVSLHLSLHLYL